MDAYIYNNMQVCIYTYTDVHASYMHKMVVVLIIRIMSIVICVPIGVIALEGFLVRLQMLALHDRMSLVTVIA